MTSILRYAETKYYRDRFESKKGNDIDTWRLINDVLQDKVSMNENCTVSELVMGGKVVSDPFEIATKLNNCFINTGPDLAKMITKLPDNASIINSMPSPNPNSLLLELCTVTKILNTTNTLASTSDVGLEGFSSKIIKNVISCIAEPLTDIFNSSFISSAFPDKMKHAKVVQIFKLTTK